MDVKENPPDGLITPQLSPSPENQTPIVQFPPHKTRNDKKLVIIISLIVVIVLSIFGGWLVGHYAQMRTSNVAVISKSTVPVATKTTTNSSTTTTPSGLQLNSNTDYGNKFSNGVLPVGDGHYSTTSAQVGYIYACPSYAQSLTSSQGGAQSRGPWFTDNNTEYNTLQKIHVQGSVSWRASFTNNVSGSTRTIVTNDLPSQPTGVFPIASTDPAYAYDRNPNSIKAQSLTYSLNNTPTYGSPQCMGGESGIMLNGIALFNAFDAGGRDAGAWEVQDSCDGHPQMDGIYHYHTLSSCISDTDVTTVIGYALDGFPITGPKVKAGDILTTADLDVCHGIVSPIDLNGKTYTTYHYVMTQDFPYSVSCFRATPIRPPDTVKS